MYLKVTLDAPLDMLFDYGWNGHACIGQRVIVPWGKQTVIGLIVQVSDHSDIPAERLRDAIAVLDDVPPLPPEWFRLVSFAAQYYLRGLGEVALPAIPALWRRAEAYRFVDQLPVSRTVKRILKLLDADPPTAEESEQPPQQPPPLLTEEQASAVARLAETRNFSVNLLHGVTGSGKTEVYLHAVADVLQRGKQALVLVPEINLTPQLYEVFRRRFPGRKFASLHSGMTDLQRATNWMSAHQGRADILLGTRLAILTPLPRLGLIVVDEEHDTSFKQQEGLRYSARDLAIVRAQQADIPVILGSATPSLETWHAAERGRYRRLSLTTRARANPMPQVRLLSLQRAPLEHGFTRNLRIAVEERLAAKEQTLIFHNRRGYAPVLSCGACGWLSPCQRCSTNVVYHKSDGRLHCHHCGWETRAPRACPTCGNVDLAPLGRGTQRIEEALTEWYPEARIARIDRDSTQRKGSARKMFDAVHAGEVDILVGTQMVAKGHDFQNLTLVGVVDADSALFSHDFRAAERLFANLVQVAGRAGRGTQSRLAEVLVQTGYPDHPVYQSLLTYNYRSFAAEQLQERESAGLPPYSHHAILRAEARKLEDAVAFLIAARELGQMLLGEAETPVVFYDPVPMAMVRVANVERAQLLIESTARPPLRKFLAEWIGRLKQEKTRVKWHLEMDPLDI